MSIPSPPPSPKVPDERLLKIQARMIKEYVMIIDIYRKMNKILKQTAIKYGVKEWGQPFPKEGYFAHEALRRVQPLEEEVKRIQSGGRTTF